ncbi:MAG: L-serine ammonia-lyase, iron-sulfur-dependent, subunit beta, partial [Clostridia bacterium]|nr:L-serine ammonia-lyase, iron-sulfur-dependent, subunit beta [Clostridia bacterium]
MNIFDIIGPIMVGPSSSHTAGAVRIGKVARMILGEEVSEARILLHGSFAKTAKGHGTDKAILGGLMGFDVDDARIRGSLLIADEHHLRYEFAIAHLGNVHPNTAKLEITGVTGKTASVMG